MVILFIEQYAKTNIALDQYRVRARVYSWALPVARLRYITGMSSSPGIDSSRRRFLKVGLLGSAVLAAAAGGVAITRTPEPCTPCLWLHQGDRELLQALVPVLLAGALPDVEAQRQQAINEIIKGVDLTVAHFPEEIRAEIRQLLWLLESPLTRGLMTGAWGGWASSDPDDVRDFLKGWQHSRLDLLRVGYTALHDLVVGAWYANPLSWQRIHYPGPPKLA